MTRQDFLVFVENFLAYQPDESIVGDPPLKDMGAGIVPHVPESSDPCQQYRGIYNTSGARDLFLGDNLDLWLEAAGTTIPSYRPDDLFFREIADVARGILQGA